MLIDRVVDLQEQTVQHKGDCKESKLGIATRSSIRFPIGDSHWRFLLEISIEILVKIPIEILHYRAARMRQVLT